MSGPTDLPLALPSVRAVVMGGVLAATGELSTALTFEGAVTAAERVMGPSSVWCTTAPDAVGWGSFESAVNGAPSEWIVPDLMVVGAVAGVLEAAWLHVKSSLLGRPSDVEPVLRFTTRSIEDSSALRALGAIDDLSVTSFIPASLGGWRWRWPLRVGVAQSSHDGVSDARVAAVRGDGAFAEHYTVGVAGRDAGPFDIVIVDVDDEVPAAGVGAVFVTRSAQPSDEPDALAAQLQHGERLSPGAVIAVPGDDLSWFPALVRELSHDRPLDAAVGIVRPDVATLADPRFMAATSLRNWLRMAMIQVEPIPDLGQYRHAMESIVGNGRFDSEGSAAASAVHVIRDLERSAPGVTLEMTGLTPLRTASPPSVGLEATSDPDPDLDLDSDSDSATQASKGLVARLTDPSGTVRSDGFVRGVNVLELRIAGSAGADEIAAVDPMMSPDPGRSIDMDVSVHVGAKPENLATTLRYPARGDGPWTAPLEIVVPARSKMLTLFITVRWKGRVIQSATLTGPVLPRRARVGPPALSFDVDVSAGTTVDDERPAADATFVLLPGTGDVPVVFDVAAGNPIEPDVLARSNRMVRKTLIATFMHPPTSLAQAAAPMADLARRGSLLRDALRGKDVGFFDDANWIHVTSFGAAAVPFELIYTHPAPREDVDIEVCSPALAGATGCAADCVDRAASGRVCPFGFWGTTKVIERRQHSGGRIDTTLSDQRVVAVRAGGVVAVTPQADADDATASTRIASAVSGFVTVGSSETASTWTELEAAMSTPRHVVCLVTHTIHPDDPDDDLGVELQLGAESRRLLSIDRRYVNPTALQPGPIVFALGCDTGTIHASYAGFVARLHSLGAEIVVSTISQVPGRETADFLERMMSTLDEVLARPGQHRFGAVLTEARRQTLCAGDVLALAIIATGDGDVRLGTN